MKSIYFPLRRMHKIITVLLLTATVITKAQYRQQLVPNQFDAFIAKPEIEWAAYASHTFCFRGFNNMLIKRFEKKEIKASMPVLHGLIDIGVIKFISKDSLDGIKLYSEREPAQPDVINTPLSDMSKYRGVRVPVDSSENSLTAVYEILYIEKGKLKSYQPFLSPRIIKVLTRSGIVLGLTDYFSTCFSSDYSAEYDGKSACKFLSQTTRRFKTDSVNTEDKLKETYGRNLVETLWPYVMKDKFKIYSFEKKKNIKATEIRHLREYLQVPVPRFDSLGKMEASPFADAEVNPSIFKYADIVQDWYYDVKKNRLVSKVKELILVGFTEDGNERRFFPVLKLIF